MKKTLIIAAAAMLIGSSGISLAGSPHQGCFRLCAGHRDEQFEVIDFAGRFRAFARRQNEGAPEQQVLQNNGMSKGASEFTPGDKMNDARKK